MKMTTKQALGLAIEALKALPCSEQTEAAVERLETLRNSSLITNWTKELAIERLNEWRDSHGRNPTVTDLAEPGMPKCSQIKRLFDMRATAFLNIYYPTDRPKRPKSKYTEMSRKEYIEQFKAEYDRIKPKSSKEYNARRAEGTPTWLTAARYLGVTTWNELLTLTEVDTRHLKQIKEPRTLTVTHSGDGTERLIALLSERIDLGAVAPEPVLPFVGSATVTLQEKKRELTYKQLIDYIYKESGVKVSPAQIAFMKRKCGLSVRERRSEKVPDKLSCPAEKERVIREAFKQLGMTDCKDNKAITK